MNIAGGLAFLLLIAVLVLVYRGKRDKPVSSTAMPTSEEAKNVEDFHFGSGTAGNRARMAARLKKEQLGTVIHTDGDGGGGGG